MKEEHIAVGISNKEIYIASVVDGKFERFDGVIRPVSTEQLEYLRDSCERMDDYKDLWKQAVQADRTEVGFENWFESVWNEEYDEDDEEDFPGKDSSDTQYLSDEDREAADGYLAESEGFEVGTWECSGSYSPRSFNKDFRHFDLVFDNPLARRIAKEYEEGSEE